MSRSKSNGNASVKDPTANLGFEAKLWLTADIHHLAPHGMAGFVLANGSMSSNQSGEGDIRRALIKADLVDCMVALPGQLFYTTQIPVRPCLLAKESGSKANLDEHSNADRQSGTASRAFAFHLN